MCGWLGAQPLGETTLGRCTLRLPGPSTLPGFHTLCMRVTRCPRLPVRRALPVVLPDPRAVATAEAVGREAYEAVRQVDPSDYFDPVGGGTPAQRMQYADFSRRALAVAQVRPRRRPRLREVRRPAGAEIGHLQPYHATHLLLMVRYASVF